MSNVKNLASKLLTEQTKRGKPTAGPLEEGPSTGRPRGSGKKRKKKSHPSRDPSRKRSGGRAPGGQSLGRKKKKTTHYKLDSEADMDDADMDLDSVETTVEWAIKSPDGIDIVGHVDDGLNHELGALAEMESFLARAGELKIRGGLKSNVKKLKDRLSALDKKAHAMDKQLNSEFGKIHALMKTLESQFKEVKSDVEKRVEALRKAYDQDPHSSGRRGGKRRGI